MNETEIRGNSSPEEFERLTQLLTREGKLIAHYHRLSVDLSPGFDPKEQSWPLGSNLDLRLKKSGDQEKISLKLGNYHDKHRREFDVVLQPGQFLETLQLFNALGFSEGMVYFWESWEYSYRDFEIKLTRFNPDYHQWEIESKSKKDPDQIVPVLKVTPFTPESFKEAINWQNKHIHQVYSLARVQELLGKF